MTAAISDLQGPKGVVPRIGLAIDKVTAEGYKIRKITLEFLTTPTVFERGRAVIYYQLHQNITQEFPGGFNKDSYSVQLINSFDGITTALSRAGTFYTLSCKTSIEAARDQDNGITQIRTRTIRLRIKGNVRSLEWRDNLFSSTALP